MAADAGPAGERVLARNAVVLGTYRVERQIGEGGFGRVYEATHLASARQVALKIGRRWEHGERLLREARMAAMLESPHAVRVLAVEHLDDGCPIIVLEFLAGASLRDYLKQEGRVSPALAVHWGLQLLEVLREAHERGLIHRDIKPSNLFLVEQSAGTPQLKLLDFGLARAPHHAGEASVTGSDLVVGSPAYMSPEQIRGDAATAQSDLWAFGVVLYEMLAGERPFQGETNAAVVASIVADPPLPWAGPRHALTPSLRRIVTRCLRKSLDDRPRCVDDVARCLREALGTPQVATDDATTLSIARPALPARAARAYLRPPVGVLIAIALAVIGGASWAARLPSADVGARTWNGSPGRAESSSVDPSRNGRSPIGGPAEPRVREGNTLAVQPAAPPDQASVSPNAAMPVTSVARRESSSRPSAPRQASPPAVTRTDRPRDAAKRFFAEPDF